MKMKNQVVVLEPSSNTHTMKANNILVEDLGGGILSLSVTGKGVVMHGEHNTVATEHPEVIKYVQQEVNPVTKAIQNAYD